MADGAEFLVGRGIADITGEAADCGMMGYGKADQKSAGIHLRLRARAFVFETGEAAFLLVVAELPLVFDSVRQAVLARLAESYGGRYADANTMITCTHTHCGPGGYSHHTLYNITTGGFHPKTFGAIVDGIVEAVSAAHADLAPARLALAFGELHDASTNRSPTSFELNPEADRAFFPRAIDPQTTLLTIERDGRLVGAVNWFATHGTSMTNKNRLISSDNKGYAAYAWERLAHGVDYLAGTPPEFVAAFAQTNAGDMSPNLNRRPGSGPTEDQFENTRIIGLRQYEAAAGLAGGGAEVAGGLDTRLTHIDLSDFEVDAACCPDGRAHRTSGPYGAAGQAAGTDEGPGFFGFRQGRNPLFDAVSGQVYRRSPALRDSQAPKALLLPRFANRITPLIQERIPVQLIRLGLLYLIGLPAEVTIVSGLRLRRAVAAIVDAPLTHVLVAGYSNGYIHYVTTPEEYLAQRYEAGSTMYGRWELPALLQTVSTLAEALRDDAPVERGTPPPDLSERMRARRRFRPDTAAGAAFGEVLVAPRASYRRGDTVRAEFAGAYPNNDLRRGSTYVEVQQSTADAWRRVADDGDWATKFHWRRVRRAGSRVTVTWDVPTDAAPGRYRLAYRGDVLDRAGALRPFTATTAPFEVT
ncbi:MAG TPA: neutral/alkaline non-lysosomal ceramidase N-terminal domain-containing protein [Jatrophihabitans sp.]|nr:neutral/alkaline non-lysosomal ceramidase N-terminal domain-containing protein [Jatrophihabitans sp.]